MKFARGFGAAAVFLLLGAVLTGCAIGGRQFVGSRPFDFQADTFTFSNELAWVYHFDSTGKWVHERREPEPDYYHHCFVVARSARQFFENAKFAPAEPVADDATYRRLIRTVVSIDPTHALPDSEKVVIPGYADLRAFSDAHEALLKSECGGAWESYFQRGHWRMIFPFSRASQACTAKRLISDVKQNRPPVVHLVRFPQLTINHAILLFAVHEDADSIRFSAYDPNNAAKPTVLAYHRATRTFTLPVNRYFPGGRVDVYEVYRSWDY